eukprot:5721554-Prymnesium_polylepis.1
MPRQRHAAPAPLLHRAGMQPQNRSKTRGAAHAGAVPGGGSRHRLLPPPHLPRRQRARRPSTRALRRRLRLE